ncbi:hypothetical protein HX773_03835 [Pantoea sp. B9002]|uniref:pentapeptide repeat-containing protein n=1 Tax=Pantoea sp. B9002 TaxID=2726979 RepID=UPI0015A04F5C|nr:hypothetical protein [Pantoea sp. B9002]NWA60023.1 hypothetical protein [Pantoea sp. B9002]
MKDNTNKVTSDNHRINNVWDVTYDKSVNIHNFIKIRIYDIGELSTNHKQFQSYIIDLTYEAPEGVDETLESVKEKADRLYIDDIQFNTCDFIGDNEGKKITFRGCTFEKAYFGYSCLNDVNFVNCSFSNVSFALTRFNRCRFDDLCRFSKISISGGTTVFTESVILPSNLIKSIYIYATKDYCKNHPNKDLDEEKSKMYTSMVKLSRNVFESVSKNGDDTYYYDAVRQIYKLKIKDRHHKKIWEIKKSKQSNFFSKSWTHIKCWFVKCAMPLETVILNTLGFLNGWGASVTRCALFGTLILAFYSFVYFFYGPDSQQVSDPLFQNIIKSVIESFDITFLAGYTKYIGAKDDYIYQLICLSNMLLGLTWYAISIPTIINKISINRI